MWEDEMTEANLAATGAEYRRVTNGEIHDEQIAVMRAYISALEAYAFGIKYHAELQSRALAAF